MSMHPRVPSVLCAIAALSAAASSAAPGSSALVVDHSYDLSALTDAVRTSLVGRNPLVHYAHRSDGSAVPFGLEALATSQPSRFPYTESVLPYTEPTGAGVRFWRGMPADSYVMPAGYWASGAGRADLSKSLKANPSVWISTWTWCNEDDYWSIDGDSTGGDNVRAYFHWMDSLERAFPSVTFVYQTAAMRDPGSDEAKIQQAAFNDSVRAIAIRRKKILFDVADLDVWHAGQKNTIVVGGKTVPYQHPAWAENYGPTNNGHHGNDSLGIDHGRAWWALMARLEAERMGLSNRYEKSARTWSRKTTDAGWVWTNSVGSRLRVELATASGRIVARAESRDGRLEIARPHGQGLLVAKLEDGRETWSEVVTR